MPYWKDINEIRGNFQMGNKSLNGYEHNVLYRNDGERFSEVGHVSGCDSVFDSRSVVVADFDLDGDEDMLVTALRKPVLLFDNLQGNRLNFLEVKTRGVNLANARGVGALVTIWTDGRRQTRQVTAGSGFLSQQSPFLFFGLGTASKIDRLEIRWPAVMKDGRLVAQVQSFEDLPVNGMLTLDQNSDKPQFKTLKAKVAQQPPAQKAPLVTLSGKAADFKKTHQGRAVIANFWATWCKPCRKEIPELNAVQAKWRSKGVEVVGISVESDASARVKQGARELKIQYPVYIAAPEFLRESGIEGAIPITIVYDQGGREVFRHAGPVTQELLAPVLEKITAEVTKNP